MFIQIRDRLNPRQWIDVNLVVMPFSIAYRSAVNSPDISGRLQGRTQVRGRNRVEVEQGTQVVVHPYPSLALQVVLQPGMRRRIDARTHHGDGHPVGGLVIQCEPDSFSRFQALFHDSLPQRRPSSFCAPRKPPPGRRS